MPTLTIGHVGLIGADLDDVEQLSGASNANGRTLDLAGTALGTTLAETKGLRDEIMAIANHADQLVPITWSGDANLDGFYRINSASFDVAALHDRGFIRFRISAELVGLAGDIVFRSVLSTGVISNDHGLTAAEVEPFHAPPAGHGAYSAVIGSVTRKSEDGDLAVYRDITDTRPLWSSTPANYLKAAAKVTVDDIVRTGLNIPNNPADWTLENGLVRVRPRRKSWGYGGSSETPNTNQPLLLPYRGTQYLHLPGSGNNRATTPDHADFDITDLELRARMSLHEWPSAARIFVTDMAFGTNGWRAYINSDSFPRLQWESSTGQIDRPATATLDSVVTLGDVFWLKITLDVDNGSGGYEVEFHYSLDDTNDPDAVTWTQLGATIVAGATTNIINPTELYEIGTDDVGNGPVMDYYYYQQLDGIDGTPILDVDFTDETALVEPFASFVENTGKTVTINRSTSGRVSTVVDKSTWIFDGTDDYITITNLPTGLFQLNDGEAITAFGIARMRSGADASPRVIEAVDSSFRWNLSLEASSRNPVAQINDGSFRTDIHSTGVSENTWFAHTGVLDRINDRIEVYVDGTSDGTPSAPGSTNAIEPTAMAIGGQPGGTSQSLWGDVSVALAFRKELTDSEITELSNWDGTVANEPSWLRTHASLALYINADDPDQQAAYMGDNQIINLADNTLTGGVLANEVGSIEVEHYNGTDWLSKIWELQTPSGTELPPWEFVSIVRNDPEESIVRLEASVAGGGRNTLDLSLRRGARHVSGYLTIPASGTIKVVRGVTEAGATFTPTGASSAAGVDAAADDDYGNRYIVGTPSSHTADTTEGGLSNASITSLGFFIGSEIGGANAQAGDLTDDVALQALALTADATRSLRR